MAWVDVQEKINEMVTEAVGAAPAETKQESESQALAPAPGTALVAVDLRQYEVQLEDLKSAVSYMLYKVPFHSLDMFEKCPRFSLCLKPSILAYCLDNAKVLSSIQLDLSSPKILRTSLPSKFLFLTRFARPPSIHDRFWVWVAVLVLPQRSSDDH